MIAEYCLLGGVALVLGLLVSAMCLSCRKQGKSTENVGSFQRPSTTDENDGIVPNIVLPPKGNERSISFSSSLSTVFACTADQITQCPASPPACHPGGATSYDIDFDDDLDPNNLDCPLYVESYPLCRSDPSTQFRMDSCGDSTQDTLSPSFVAFCDEKGSDDTFYDYPQCNIPVSFKKSANGASCSSRLMPTFDTTDVIVHPEPTPWKKTRSATMPVECPSFSPYGDELIDEDKEENVYEELDAIDVKSDKKANGNHRSDLERARGRKNTKTKHTKSSSNVSVSRTLPAHCEVMCPPPCTGPSYVNFKGRIRSWKPPSD
ncbi:uncharacterized protein LOC124134566 [Haliotis rufescens]|uniref:uncharacterized protein LOC124134566 n=1 Tax=Haliotis rufescens TaxID=6454 RepID=UPI00201F16A1|nr:uncharacterized protein LOC124134566 [Haliotis rufescens]